jgi:hypothetical protein
MRREVVSMLINLCGEGGKRIEEGKTVFLCIVLYDVEGDNLQFLFAEGADKEEKFAVLQKFLNVPTENIT